MSLYICVKQELLEIKEIILGHNFTIPLEKKKVMGYFLGHKIQVFFFK